MNLLKRFWFLINHRRLQRELEEEMMLHAEHSGQRFADLVRWRERSLDEWGWSTLDEFTQDIRYRYVVCVDSPLLRLRHFCFSRWV